MRDDATDDDDVLAHRTPGMKVERVAGMGVGRRERECVCVRKRERVCVREKERVCVCEIDYAIDATTRTTVTETRCCLLIVTPVAIHLKLVLRDVRATATAGQQ